MDRERGKRGGAFLTKRSMRVRFCVIKWVAKAIVPGMNRMEVPSLNGVISIAVPTRSRERTGCRRRRWMFCAYRTG